MKNSTLLFVFWLAACGGGSDETAAPVAVAPDVASDTAAAQSDDAPLGSVVAPGTYQLSVTRVEDACFDGALALVFKPNGDNGPYLLKNSTDLPSPAATPAAGVIRLEAPFTDMPVTWQAGVDGGLRIIDGKVAAVALGMPGSQDCAADIAVDADVTATAAGLVVSAQVTLERLTSPTQTCPVAPSGCHVHLELSGALSPTGGK